MNIIVATKFDELLVEVVIKRSGLVSHRDGYTKLVGILARSSRPVVYGQHGSDVRHKYRRSAHTHFFGQS